MLCFSKCSNTRCLTCKFMDPSLLPKSDSDFKPPPFCKANNVIYCITCNSCQQKYVGQTSQPLHKRINGHRSDINICKNKKDIEIQHFRSHDFKNISINILHFETDKSKRLQLETFYMIQYRTIYPYGLNSNFGEERFNKSDKKQCIYSLFGPTVSHSQTKRHYRGNGSKRLPRIIDFEQEFLKINNTFVNTLNCAPVLCFLFKMNLAKLKASWKFVCSLNLHSQFWDIYKDMLLFRLGYIPFVDKNDNVYFTVDFHSKVLDNINLGKLLNNFNHLLPQKPYPKFSIAFRYSPPFSKQMFNYKQTLQDNDACICLCEKAEFKKFVNPYHKHIITGDLSIITNTSLKNIMKRGTKYRPERKHNLKFLLKEFHLNLSAFLSKLSSYYGFPLSCFAEWKNSIFNKFSSLLKEALSSYSTSSRFFFKKSKDLDQAIKSLKNNFVITTVDKASNNYSFICKKFYKEIICKELSNSATFAPAQENFKIKYKKIVSKLIKLKLYSSNFQNIPFMHALPKFHKSPIKFRFITSTVNSFYKQAHVLLQNILSKILNFIILNEPTWIINNNKKLLSFIKARKITNIQCFDFENLFTSIPLTELRNTLNLIFQKYNFLISVDFDTWNDLLDICIFNNFVIFGEEIFLQIKGIPMGSNFSSSLANLFLHFYEMDFINKILPLEIFAFRYIDDLIVLNDEHELCKQLTSIYPKQLTLKNTNSCLQLADFLDINLKIHNGKIYTSVFDKRNSFKFYCVTVTHWTSNISKKVFKNIIIAQSLRYFRICNSKKNFLSIIYCFLNKLYLNEYPLYFIRYCMKIFFHKIKKHELGSFPYKDLHKLLFFMPNLRK